MNRGLAAEFAIGSQLLRAISELRRNGYRQLDAFVPYSLDGLEAALGLSRSQIGRFVFLAGLLGAATAYLIQWGTSALDYPLNVGGRPAHAAPAFVPIAFETLVLFAGLAACIGLLLTARLPRLFHPLDSVPGFERATLDRFFLAVDARDPLFSAHTGELLVGLGAVRVSPFGES